MYNHAPKDYNCPICLAIAGIENDETWIKQADIFYKDEVITGFISSKFIRGNEGHVLLVPNKHYENIYDLQPKVGHRIISIGKKVAIALKRLETVMGLTLFKIMNQLQTNMHFIIIYI